MRRVQPPISRKDREDLDRALWRVLTCTVGSSRKFWQIRAAGRWTETQWGRMGTRGQCKVKDYGSVGECAAAVLNLVHQKLGKGYIERLGESEALPVRDDLGNVVTRRAFAHPAPPQIRPDRLLEVVGNEVAVYAQRDVYGMGPGGARLVHERGHRQLLPSALASEIVGGRRGDYGYWHPDSETEPPDSSNELTAMQVVAENFRQQSALAFEGSAEEEARRLMESFGQTAESFRFLYQQEVRSPQAPRGMVQSAMEDAYQQFAGRPIINSGRGRSPWGVRIGGEDVTPLIESVEFPEAPLGTFTEMDVSSFLGNEPWRVYQKNTVAQRWYIRQQGVYLETANTDSGSTGPRRGRKFTNALHARQAMDVYIQAMEENGFRFLATQDADFYPERSVAAPNPDLAVDQEQIAIRMRCTVALGRFSTIDEEEEIL